MTASEPSVSHVRLLTDDFPRTHGFYADVVGLEPRFDAPDGPYEEFDAGGVVLALYDAEMMAEAIGSGGAEPRGGDAVSIGLPVDSVDEQAAALAESGVEIVARPTDREAWVIRTVHCRDPDGTLLEFYEPLEG